MHRRKPNCEAPANDADGYRFRHRPSSLRQSSAVNLLQQRWSFGDGPKLALVFWCGNLSQH